MPNPFATASMAEGYARARPPLHAHIFKRIVALLGGTVHAEVALDLGCGSGLSTRPLHAVARRVVGVDPVAPMLSLARAVSPQSAFIAARAEAVPLRSASVDLIAAAGSLNYADPPAALREAARLLAPSGVLCVYDFSQGRTFQDSAALETWFTEFVRRYPRPASEAIPLDPEILAGLATGFRVLASERFAIATPLSHTAYVDYLMTETNVAAAIRNGVPESEIRAWLQDSLYPLFGTARPQVMFPGYAICFRHA